MARTTGLPEDSAFHTSENKSIVVSGSFDSLKMLTSDPKMEMMDIKQFTNFIRPNTKGLSGVDYISEILKWPRLPGLTLGQVSVEPSHIDIVNLGNDAHFYVDWIKPSPRIDYIKFNSSYETASGQHTEMS